MFAFLGRPPMKVVHAGLLSIVAGAAAGGCANTNASYSANGTPTAYVAQGPAVPMESDGLPVQAAPSSTIRQLPDDPSQPFSPNYGGSNPANKLPSRPTIKASNEATRVRTLIRAIYPPTSRTQLIAQAG